MIDYKLLSESVSYYNFHGFTQVEAPWTISEEFDNITRPEGRVPFKIKDKCLVASAEQSFLEMYNKRELPLGTFQAITPCFRDEEELDELHKMYFMKNELIKTDVVNDEELSKIIDVCLGWFQPKFNKTLDVVKTDIGFDIEVDGKELGSYGIRECEFVRWIYATGCAEPRLSTLMKIYNV